MAEDAMNQDTGFILGATPFDVDALRAFAAQIVDAMRAPLDETEEVDLAS